MLKGKKNIMLKTYKYRLYLTKKQTETLQWTLDHCRELYNAALQERRDAYNISVRQHPNYYDEEACKELASAHAIGYSSQCAELPEIKETREEYTRIHSQVLQDVLRRVDKAMKAFFKRVRNGQKPGYPRFQGEGRYDSFTYPQAGFSLTHDNRLCLSKIGTIKIKMHREVTGRVKTCTVKREGEYWYVCFTCEGETAQKLPFTDLAVGIDMGLLHFATNSNGDTIEKPRHFRKSHGLLKKRQQRLSSKKKSSNRRKKAAQKVARTHRKIRNQRYDFHHKAAHQLVSTYETIVFEDLSIHNLVKRPKPKQDENGKYLPNGASAKSGLNKSIQDAGWASFIELVEYKAACAGVTVYKVNPRKTSQICSACGHEGEHKDLSVRTFICIHCGLVLDRDVNAAINILNRGLGRSLRETAWAGTFLSALREAPSLKGRGVVTH
jgi:putative transposase